MSERFMIFICGLTNNLVVSGFVQYLGDLFNEWKSKVKKRTTINRQKGSIGMWVSVIGMDEWIILAVFPYCQWHPSSFTRFYQNIIKMFQFLPDLTGRDKPQMKNNTWHITQCHHIGQKAEALCKKLSTPWFSSL